MDAGGRVTQEQLPSTARPKEVPLGILRQMIETRLVNVGLRSR